jgi:hypothetical protein
VKLAYSAFVLILVPHYWRSYGPTNFLYFCDVAAFFTLGAVWLEWPILASMPAIGILLPQSLWTVDFLGELVGLRLTGMTGYMWDEKIPLFTRLISLFHFWLPILLVCLVWRLGYDRRALRTWTLFAWGLVLICYAFTPAPPAPADDPLRPVNINYIYGFGDSPQTWLPQPAYVALMLVVLAVGIYWPTHLILRRLFPRASKSIGSPATGRGDRPN